MVGRKEVSCLHQGRALLGPLFPGLIKMSSKTDHPGTCCFARGLWSLQLAGRGLSLTVEQSFLEEENREVPREPSQGTEKLPPLQSLEFPPLLGFP